MNPTARAGHRRGRRARQRHPPARVGTWLHVFVVGCGARFGRVKQWETGAVTPREFLDNVVRPNITEFHAHIADERRAFNAVAAVDSLSAHIYVWCKSNAPQAIAAGIQDDSQYRGWLANSSPDFRLLRDIAKAQKHVHLTRGSPEVTRAAQVTPRSLGFNEAPFNEGEFDSPLHVVVTMDDGRLRYVAQIVTAALAVLEIEMTGLGI